MTITMISEFLIIFGLNAISTSLGTLKTIFLSKQIIKPVYFTTFIDAMIFAYAFRLIADSSGLLYILVYALGRIAGVFLGNFIESKVAIGLLEITVYKHPEEGKVLADQLRAFGYSVTTTVGYGIEGKNRLVLSIISPRRDLPQVRELIFSSGKANMSIKNISKVSGKVGYKCMPAGKPLS